jgi:predicted acetyltransferase
MQLSFLSGIMGHEITLARRIFQLCTIQLQVNYISQLNSANVLEHVEQSHDLWGKGTSVSERHAKQLKRMSDAGPEMTFMSGIVNENGNLLASLKRYYFTLKVADKSYRCLGLGGVYTHKDHRKKSLAAQLIKTVCEESRARYGCSFALLFSDISPSYYEKFGFKATPANYWKIPSKESAASKTFELREATPQDLDALLKTYSKLLPPKSIHCERSEKTWRFFREINAIEKDFVLSVKNRDVGFLSYTVEPEYLWVSEALAIPEYLPELWAALQKIALEKKLIELKSWKLSSAYPQDAIVYERTKAIPMISELSDLKLSAEQLQHAYFAPPDHF